MEPKSQLPRFEYQPQPTSPEANPEVTPVTPEYGQALDRRHEQVEQRADATLGAAPAVLPVPVPSATLVTPATDTSMTGASPATAADEDLIEKEWVDRAKQIIEQTKDDPYRREQEVNKLQADYLRKRYGRELGSPQ